jgi:exodeoxyribonuclease VII small subunit
MVEGSEITAPGGAGQAGDDATYVALSFEQALGELEGIVRRLESGDVPLDESIALYARGEELRKQCSKRLEDAEAKIQKLTLDGAAVTGARPFDAG